ncbi:MAG: hypothetical protein PUB94_07405 [Oscillospiraceae bacterium]|nr:hypothetical protein [Oscillospiraceae bacterium]
MKKIISFLLVLCFIFSSTTAALAATVTPDDYCEDPVIYIGGDSDLIYYNNDTQTFRIDDILGSVKTDDDESKDKIYEATANILLPFILEGISFGKWDNYYAAVEKEIGDLFEPIRLDKNGNVPEGSDSGIGQEAKNDRQWKMTHNLADANGMYSEKTYTYRYDWRLDPIELADDLNEYIEGVKRATGHSKVSLDCKCLGTNVVLAYINKYGTGSIKGLGIDVATSNGADFLSGIISGDFGIDGNSFVRLFDDLNVFGRNFSISPLVTVTIELLANSGVLDNLSEVARKTIYGQIEYGIISALATATFLTMPCYWALVTTEDFDDALVYVFGEEGSEKRQEYAGLIEKITVYNDTVKKNVDKILLSTKIPDKDGKTVNLCIISKYGTQMVPLLKDGSVLGDQYVSANKSSFGATTSTIYDTLSDEYIAQREAEGLGKYISPDKQIDASTCLFPDYTWFIKGCSHGFYSTEERQLILTTIDADRQLEIDDFDWTQFIVFDHPTRTFEAMTEENCHNENWEADENIEKPKTKSQRLFSFIITLIKWIETFFETLANKR